MKFVFVIIYWIIYNFFKKNLEDWNDILCDINVKCVIFLKIWIIKSVYNVVWFDLRGYFINFNIEKFYLYIWIWYLIK